MEEALEAYDKALELEPNNAATKKSRDEVEQALSSSAGKHTENLKKSWPLNSCVGDMFGNLLKGDIWTKLRTSPKTAAFCNQPDFIQIVNNIQKNPQLMTSYVFVMEALAT